MIPTETSMTLCKAIAHGAAEPRNQKNDRERNARVTICGLLQTKRERQ